MTIRLPVSALIVARSGAWLVALGIDEGQGGHDARQAFHLTVELADFEFEAGVAVLDRNARHRDRVAEPGLYVKLQRSRRGFDMISPCDGLHSDDRCSRHAIVASTPLSDREWPPLKPGEIVCFEHGRRV